MRNVKNKLVVILGAARSGLAAARLLHGMGAKVFVSDTAAVDKKSSAKDLLEHQQIDFEFGGHSNKIFAADFIILSPGIPLNTQEVQEVLAKGIPVYSELEVASWFCRAPLIAVTGSNGKTTTTTLLGEMIRTEKPGSLVAGNIGRAFSEVVCEAGPEDWAVIEVSSFQLETIDAFHPRIVLILNLAPNHLDWYSDYQDYITAKMRILKNLDSADQLIYNADDTLLSERIKGCPASKSAFSLRDHDVQASLRNNALYLGDQELIQTAQIGLKGAHNYQNAMAAALAARIAGISDENIRDILKIFRGVEHRLEFVGIINGITFINDSKATTVESLAVALQSFDQPLILIAGGKDKGSDYKKLDNLLVKNVRSAVLIGSAREKIGEAWQDIIPLQTAATLDEAVELAFSNAQPGETVILSPACSSYDMFHDFEERGRKFKEIVFKLKEHYEHN
jgi:UDP-N-acetylmuramoylalanine--D-glutamate ligase